MYKDSEADPETKAAYKLPVMKLKNGELTLFWNGVRAAMARLLGGGGKIDIPDDERKKIYNRLEKVEDGKQLDTAETEAGKKLGKLLETVKGIEQRLDVTERSIARSQQPGEGQGGSGGGG